MSIVTTIPDGSASARPFIPARDFGLSKRFYETLGFTKLLDGDVAVFGIGESRFILVNGDHGDTAGNFMMQLMVDDLDAWWAHIQALDLSTHFNVKSPTAPAMQPWGLRIAYVFDPSGVLWHVAERRDGDALD
jgi:hypothetical protein